MRAAGAVAGALLMLTTTVFASVVNQEEVELIPVPPVKGTVIFVK